MPLIGLQESPAPVNPAPDPINAGILVVLGVAGFITVIPLMLMALSVLRNEIVAQGWVKRNSKLGQMAVRSETANILPVLEGLGLNHFVANALRATNDEISRQANNGSAALLGRPDRAFLERARDWVYRLDDPFTYKRSGFYLDMMGALDGRKHGQLSLEQIFDAWITRLVDDRLISAFDVVLAPKDGNVLLCRAVAERLNKPLILCKNRKDRARVDRPDPSAPHVTDFEGLRIFYEGQPPRASNIPRKFRALVIDDSCSNGTQLTEAARGFNTLVSTPEISSQIKFEPISECVVLFRALAGSVTRNNFDDAHISLHALVAVGPTQLESLSNDVPNADDIAKMFKSDDFSCSSSRRIYDQ